MADQVKLAVIYYSATGHVHALAQMISDAAEKAGAEVRLRKVKELAPAEAIASNPQWAAAAEATKDIAEATPDDIDWAEAVILGTPTRYGNVSSQLKQYLDQLGPLWGQGKLADKVYSGFTASQTLHGGQESTLLALYNTIHHFGGILVAPGYTDGSKFVDGNPYGVSHVSGGGNDIEPGDVERTASQHLAERVVTVASQLKAGRAAAL